MADSAKKKEQSLGSKIKSWWTNLKAEFKKIIWPDQKTVVKETTAVIIVSIILGIIIKLLDMAIQLGIDKLFS